MKLQAALGTSKLDAAEMGEAFTGVLTIAESLGDSEYQLRAFRGLYFYHAGSGQFRAALPYAQKFHRLATRGSDQFDRLFGEHYMGAAQHYIGDQITARRHLEHVLAHAARALSRRPGGCGSFGRPVANRMKRISYSGYRPSSSMAWAKPPNAPNRPYMTLSSTCCLLSPQLNAQTTSLTPDMLEPRIIPL